MFSSFSLFDIVWTCMDYINWACLLLKKTFKKKDNSRNKIQEVSATLVHPKKIVQRKSQTFPSMHSDRSKKNTKVRQLLDRWHEVHKMVVWWFRLMVVGKLRLMIDDGWGRWLMAEVDGWWLKLMVDGSGGWLMMAAENKCNCLHKFTEKSTAVADPEFFVVPKAMSWFEHVFSSGDFFVFRWLGMSFSQSWIYGRWRFSHHFRWVLDMS